MGQLKELGQGTVRHGSRLSRRQRTGPETVVHTETFNLITIMITITITIAITITLMIMLAQESKAIIEMKSAEAKSKDSTQFINIQLMCHKQVQHKGREREGRSVWGR